MSASVTNDQALARRPGVEALVLAVLVVVNLAVGALGGLAAQQGVDGWDADADKVPWTPPNGVFAPVWTVLYVLMAVAAWLVWRRGGWSEASGPLTLYVVQLALNAAWTPVFFNGRLVWLALAIIVAAGRPRGHGRRVQPSQPGGRLAARALPRVGRVRDDAQPRVAVLS